MAQVGCCGAGDTTGLIELMEATASDEGRQNVLKCLMQAPADARERVGRCPGAMASLNAWLQDMVDDGRSAATLQLLLKASNFDALL